MAEIEKIDTPQHFETFYYSTFPDTIVDETHRLKLVQRTHQRKDLSSESACAVDEYGLFHSLFVCSLSVISYRLIVGLVPNSKYKIHNLEFPSGFQCFMILAGFPTAIT